MQMVVDELLVSYRSWGEAKRTILLLHGWGDTSGSFAELAQGLQAHYSLIAPDLPGFGGTDTPPDAWTVNDYSTFIGHFLDKLGCKPYAIIAHSNGGTLALHGLANSYFDTKKMVLLASAGIRGARSPRKVLLRTAAKPVKISLKVLPKRAQARIKRRVYGALGSDLYVAEHLQETFKHIVSYDVQEDAKSVYVETLLVYGSEDRSTPVRYGELLAATLPKAELVVVEGAGHFVHHDAADQVTGRIQEFLK
jgi:pimeloyl-ACP methyl ester carboxylesterase